jgi:RHS repeat-associated protein
MAMIPRRVDHRDTCASSSARGSDGRRRYDAFGELVDRENPTGGDLIDFAAFDFAYTGRPLDSATGLYDYRARWYDAALGRFASEDPIGLAGGDVHLYRYVGNSPANGTDPSGLIVVRGVDDGVTSLENAKRFLTPFFF